MATTDTLPAVKTSQMSTPNPFLVEHCHKSVDMLKRLTTPPEKSTVKSYDIIPRTQIRNCKGVQFMDVKLMGAVVNITRGCVFTLRKLGKLNGVTQWSAPCFLRLTNVGVGFTFGYDDIQSVVILGSDEVLDKHKGVRNLFHVDLDLIIGRDSAVVQSDVSETMAIPYSLAGGTLIDFSVKGGRVTIDHKTNTELYGASVLPENILQGGVQPPAEFMPLYEALNALSAESS